MKRFLFILWTCCIPMLLHAQNLVITGKVLDEKGKPLPGAVIKIVGSTTGSATDNAGSFTLKVPDIKTRLTVSFVGYVTQSIAINGSKALLITMVPVKGDL